jgi:hypothetical protein
MAKSNRFKERDNASYKREIKNIDTKEGRKDPLIVLSFKDFDRSQGQSFVCWEKEHLLALAVSRLHELCQLTVGQATAQQIVKPYTKTIFPSHSKFKQPQYVMPDVIWCSMHIQGKECIIGYFERNIFNIVFLDKNHDFWPTRK